MRYGTKGNKRCRLTSLGLACVATLATIGPRASAGERTWKPANGIFGFGPSWAEGVPPGQNDNALFNTGPSLYGVGFSLGDATTNDLSVLEAQIQFSLSSHTYTVTDSAFVGYNPGELGRLTLVGPGTLAPNFMALGEFNGSSGNVTLLQGAALQAGTLFVGASGEGTLTVGAGTSLQADTLSLGSNSDGRGTVAVSGAGATFTAGAVNIGSAGIGTMTFSGGATAVKGNPAARTTIGGGAAADGLLLVTGGATMWSTGILNVGEGGRGELDIDAGATVNADGLNVGVTSASRGIIIVRGNGSTLNLGGLANDGSGFGVVNIEAGATVNANHYAVANTNLDGGVLTAADLSTPIHFNAGAIQINNAKGMAVGPDVTAGQSGVNADFAVPAGGTLKVTGQLNVGANRRLSVGDGGTIEVGAAATDVSANAGTLDVIRGTLLAHNAFVNQAGGNLTVVGSNLVTFQAGLQNSGSVTLTGVGVAGAVTNAPTGAIYVADTATFGGKVTNNGTIAAAGSVSFNGGLTNNGAINVTGTQNVASPSSASFVTTGGVDGAGSLTVGAGAAAATTYVKQQSLHVTDRGGLYLLASATPTASVVKSLQIDAGGKIDLTNNSLIVDYNAGASPLPAVRAAVLAKSITSSALTSRTAIGYAEATDVPATSRQGADDSAVIVRQTLFGDADLNGAVDFNDLVRLAQSYNTQVSTATDSWWAHGDFTGDGVNDFNDLVKLAQNYNTSLGAATAIPGASVAFESDLGRAFASVPEPSFAGIAGVAALCGLSVRRRRGRSLM